MGGYAGKGKQKSNCSYDSGFSYGTKNTNNVLFQRILTVSFTVPPTYLLAADTFAAMAETARIYLSVSEYTYSSLLLSAISLARWKCAY